MKLEIKEIQKLENGLIFQVTTIGANIELKSHTDKKTAWATLTVPDTKPILVGIGDCEEETEIITLDNLEEALRLIVTTVENSLKPKGDF